MSARIHCCRQYSGAWLSHVTSWHQNDQYEFGWSIEEALPPAPAEALVPSVHDWQL
jgi:hypothetical protein